MILPYSRSAEYASIHGKRIFYQYQSQTERGIIMKNWQRSAMAILIIVAFAALGSAQESKTAQNMPTDEAFLKKVSGINLAEIELGMLAQKKGSNDAIKQFGKLMVSDHSDAETATKQLASDLNVMIPEKPGKDVADIESRLSSMGGAQFDEDYIHHMVAGHNGAVAMIENEIEHGKNPKIKEFAETILPTVQDHLCIGENVVGKMGMSGEEGLSQPDKAIEAAAKPK
jgi:predicted outer membrane protein